jgi:uncharacterized protein
VTPAIYAARLTHVRTERAVRTLGTRLDVWLVDLDDVPEQPWWLRPFAGFRAADHLGQPDRPLRHNVVEWLADKGVDATGDRILMLTTPRVLGYAFNPLTVFWCLRTDGSPRCVVAEVHNTYHERHPYLFHVDESGRAETDKAFYVSPFLGGGRYRVRLPVPGERLALSVVLYRAGRPALRATLTGRRHPATTRRVLRSAVRHPLQPHRIRAAIQAHGIVMWLRGFPIVPKP